MKIMKEVFTICLTFATVSIIILLSNNTSVIASEIESSLDTNSVISISKDNNSLITPYAILGEVKVKTHVTYTRENGSSAWVLQSEAIITSKTINVSNGYSSVYYETDIKGYPAYEGGSVNVIKTATRYYTYKTN